MLNQKTEIEKKSNDIVSLATSVKINRKRDSMTKTKLKQLTKNVSVYKIEKKSFEQVSKDLQNNNVELFVALDDENKRRYIARCKKLNIDTVACKSFFEAKFFCNPDGNNEVVKLDFDTIVGKKDFYIPFALSSNNNLKNIIQ